MSRETHFTVIYRFVQETDAILGKRAVFGTNYSSSKKGVTGIFERIIWMIRKRNPIRKRLKKKK